MPPKFDRSKCLRCIGCVAPCPTAALSYDGKQINCDESKCINCRNCLRVCPAGAVYGW
jgi:ferredoxin